ncbi:MAG: Acetoin:2,6-dichlorophenolindophenol oxidoreductase subunit alpha [Actinobacteria bacterium ADurb.Bin346]|nr:MAG: Acetoin:2,6-dichlorophenolindophenol oxidoreductase subunit alpha [Actinobacteria bacterium ADurb.Bin346]
MAVLTKELKKDLLKTIIKIRRFEEKTIQLYQIAKIWGYLHPYIGEEAIAAGACAAISKSDYIISTHRGHGHSIAKGADLNRMMAELLGKATGYCKGRGGSMHIADTELGMLGANGIVGGGIPISVGAGFSCKMEGKGRVAVCFFSDGATNNGVFHEALNMAAIFSLPVIYLCENNMYAISMCSDDAIACRDVAKRSAAYDIPGVIVDGTDPEAVYNIVSKAVQRARSGKGPSLIEAKTYRFGGHHPNDPAEYRDKSEAEYYKKEKDPVVNYKAKLLEEKVISPEEIDGYEKEIIQMVEQSVKFAEESPEPSLEQFLEEVRSI